MDVGTEPNVSYRSFLRQALIEKQRRNPRFSMRALAKNIGVHFSFLSLVLNGKRDLSEDNASRIAEALGMDERSSRRFLLLLQLEKAASPGRRSALISELKTFEPEGTPLFDLAVEQFTMISEWYHLPLQLMIDMPGFTWSPIAAARALGISVHEVNAAIQRLERLELIEKDGKGYRRTEEGVCVASPFMNEALRKYHTQMLQKTIEALSSQKPDKRYTGTVNLALSKAQLDECRAILDETRKKLGAVAMKSASKKKVYHVNLNLIHLMKETLA